MPPGGQLRDEAATWFALMRGPEAEQHRAAFEAWLARGALHRSAYNRIGEVFSLGKGLRRMADEPVRASETSPSMRSRRRMAMLVSLVMVAIVGGWGLIKQASPPGSPSRVLARQNTDGGGAFDQRQLATRLGEIRSFRLADGSIVTLDTDSLLVQSYTAGARDLRLVRGRGRFDVAHELRPFVVSAGRGTVTARGTLFDVRIGSNEAVDVRLLRGVIDVHMPKGRVARLRQVTRLSSGQGIAFGDTPGAPANLLPAPIDETRWPEATREFDRAALSDVLAEANRYALFRTRVDSRDLGSVRISGTFRIDDPARLAERLALLLDLVVEKTPSGDVVLHRRRTGA